MRVFLDANVLFSAALPKSRVRRLIRIANRRATLLTNTYAAEEARRNLACKKAGLVPAFEKLLLGCEMVGEMRMFLSAPLARKDIPILGGAIAGNASHLLTGDERDFGALFGKTIQGVRVVSPHMFAVELVKRKWMK
ncbi:MAG: DNA-binding protein [Patescibacteria group bacterium]